MPVETIIGYDPEVDDETLADSGFCWRERNGVKVLICQPLELAGFVNGFSTRLGGVSNIRSETPGLSGGDLNLAGFDEDLAANIEENRRRFLAVLDGEFTLSTVWQVHGDAIKVVRSDADARETDEKFDAIASDLPDLLIGVKTADCVPVLIGDPVSGAFAAVHAGWRGTARSIAKKAVETLASEFGARPESMLAAIGPSACGRKYEIGHDVIDAFAESLSTSGKYFTPTTEGHALVDLQAANFDQLTNAGIGPSNIFTSPFCTIERTDLFYSYRVEKRLYGRTGRSLSVIGRKNPLPASANPDR